MAGINCGVVKHDAYYEIYFYFSVDTQVKYAAKHYVEYYHWSDEHHHVHVTGGLAHDKINRL